LVALRFFWKLFLLAGRLISHSKSGRMKKYFYLVATLLPLFTRSVSAQTPPADTIFLGGNVVTVNPAQPEVEALAVKDGKILALGKVSQLEKFKGPNTEIIDLKGKALLPGFIEPHGHPFDSALAQFYAVDIRPFTVENAAQVDQAVRKAVAVAKPGAWVLLNGLDPLLQKNVQAPSLDQLDRWAPHNPLAIINNSGHAAYGNSLALQAAGINDQTPSPPGSSIGKDKFGKLTGTVEELPAVNLLLEPMLKAIQPEQMAELLRRYYSYLASDGITAVSDMSFQAQKLPIYQALEKDPLVPVRVRLYEIAREDRRGALPPMGGSDLVRQNGIKWWADGSPWLGTIAVSPPYENNKFTQQVMKLPPNTVGPLNYKDSQQLEDWIVAYYAQGYQVAIHCEGELAIEQSLNAFETVMKKHPRSDSRPRLEHVPLITEAQLQRAQTLGVQISFLMAHLYYWGDLLPKMFGEARANHWNPTSSAEKLGMPFTFHNDGPVTPASPLHDFQIAQLRQTESGQVRGAEQIISIDAAIRARTINAAHELFMEKQTGSLEPGKWADLVVLGSDPRKVRPDQIWKIPVEATYLNGKQVWSVSNPSKSTGKSHDVQSPPASRP
jgi:predicted amidohydrolase YtcJ